MSHPVARDRASREHHLDTVGVTRRRTQGGATLARSRSGALSAPACPLRPGTGRPLAFREPMVALRMSPTQPKTAPRSLIADDVQRNSMPRILAQHELIQNARQAHPKR